MINYAIQKVSQLTPSKQQTTCNTKKTTVANSTIGYFITLFKIKFNSTCLKKKSLPA